MSLGYDVTIWRLNKDERATAAADPAAFAPGLGIFPDRERLWIWTSTGLPGLRALDFLDRMVEEGTAYRGNCFNGYPCDYMVPADKVGVPLEEVPADEWVYVQAWDVS